MLLPNVAALMCFNSSVIEANSLSLLYSLDVRSKNTIMWDLLWFCIGLKWNNTVHLPSIWALNNSLSSMAFCNCLFWNDKDQNKMVKNTDQGFIKYRRQHVITSKQLCRHIDNRCIHHTLIAPVMLSRVVQVCIHNCKPLPEWHLACL